MKNYIYLMHTTPSDEPCAQVGNVDYMTMARIETKVYINQLVRRYGVNPSGTQFKVSECPHDFGPYLDIQFFYDDEDQQHVQYMNEIEIGCDTWDLLALKELKERNYHLQRSRTVKIISIKAA